MVRARLLAAVTAVCAVAAPVAVAAWTPGGGDHFWLTAGAGSGAVPFAEGGEVGAAVPAPGGHTIAFATTEGIVIWDADRATATRVAPSSDSSFPPAWSPDGSQLAVEVPRGVEVVGADGTGDHLVPYRASNIDEVAWATPHRLLMNVRKGSGATTARRLLLVDTRTWAQSLLPWRNTKQAAPLTGDRFVAIRESPRPLGTTSLSVLSTDGASAHWLSGPDGVARFAVAPGATRIAAVTEGEEGRALWLLRTNGPPRRLGSWNSLEGDPEDAQMERRWADAALRARAGRPYFRVCLPERRRPEAVRSVRRRGGRSSRRTAVGSRSPSRIQHTPMRRVSSYASTSRPAHAAS